MKPIEPSDLRPADDLTRTFFRATNPHVTAGAFDQKWEAALETPLRFMRSFPQAWYVDLLDLPEGTRPDAFCTCFGDAHPENFGVITFEEGPRYVFNDLDDSGPGYAALDALRYFTTLELAGYGALTREIAQLYEDVITGREPARELPERLMPDIAKRDQKELGKWLDDGEFRYDEPKRELVPVDDRKQVEGIVRALEEAGALEDLEVVSVAQRGRAGGGSGGLARFLVLARHRREERVELLEFKETTHAATSWLRSLHEEDDRLARVQRSIWKGLTPRRQREVALGRTIYLLRDRLGRGKVKLEKLHEDDQRRVLEVQASMLATQHRYAFLGVDASRLDEWLSVSVATMAERYRELYERHAGKRKKDKKKRK